MVGTAPRRNNRALDVFCSPPDRLPFDGVTVWATYRVARHPPPGGGAGAVISRHGSGTVFDISAETVLDYLAQDCP